MSSASSVNRFGELRRCIAAEATEDGLVEMNEQTSDEVRQLAYYKRKIDELAGENFRLDTLVASLKHDLRQKRQGFALLSTLQQTIGVTQEISGIFENAIAEINKTLGMDRTVVLTPSAVANCYRPVYWSGYHREDEGKFASRTFRFPEAFAEGEGRLLVSASSEATPLTDEVRRVFDLSSFVCLAVMVEGEILGLLLSGRLKEMAAFSPPLDQGDVDTLQAIAGLVSASVRNLRLARQIQEEVVLRRVLEEELETARELQMGLMPKESPRIEGLDVTARCIPATQVGGDFFQYFDQDGWLSVSTADVTGHAMEAAIPVVMFEGVLDAHMRLGPDLESLFSSLNDVMSQRLSGRTHVCFSMVQINRKSRAIRFANAGCPYPYHYQASMGEIIELQVDAYPLGVRGGTTYTAIESQLEAGDRLVFCSDGIIEAMNSDGEMFGFGRTAETIRQGCHADLTAEGLLDQMLSTVRSFSGERDQEDDQTIVVVGVES